MSTACRINSLLRQNFVKKEGHANGDAAGHTTNSLPTPPTPYMHKTRTFLEKKKTLHSAWLSDTASCRGGSVANRLHLSACI